MIVDLHTHTSPASICSQMVHEEYVERCLALAVEAIALTNHGTIEDNLILAPLLAESGILLLHGVEISTLWGDFLVYSPDLEYLATLRPVQHPLRRAQIPRDAAVVWAHPAAGGGMSRSAYFPGLEHDVAPNIDAVEVYNGNWPGNVYIDQAARLALDLGLPAVGGSDAHRGEAVMRFATRVQTQDGRLSSTADLVDAIHEGRVSPWRPEAGRSDRQR
jgi:predicted metal-dependent phosphoesterase TrpH